MTKPRIDDEALDLSQTKVNDAVRKLCGRNLKYTVLMLLKDGTYFETQTATTPEISWSDAARELIVICKADDSYTSVFPLMRWADVQAMHVEVNP